jgi:hypothetical protein
VKVLALMPHCALNPAGAANSCLFAFTVTTTSALDENCPSLTVTRSVYVPATENEAWVREELGLAKTTPVPLTTLQLYVNTALGKPPSVAVAVRIAVSGSVIVPLEVTVIAGPAFPFGELTVTCGELTLTCTWFEAALSRPATLTARTT